MPNCCSPRCCGRISELRILPGRFRNSRRGSGVLAHALSDVAQASPNGRWSDFWVRLGSAAILGPIALFCVWHGGRFWELFVGAALLGLGAEWTRLARVGQSALLPCLLLAVWVCEIKGGWLPGLLAVLVMTGIACLATG